MQLIRVKFKFKLWVCSHRSNSQCLQLDPMIILWTYDQSPIVLYFQNEIEKGSGCIRFIDLENDQRRAWNCSYKWLCSTSTTSTLLVRCTELITSNIIIVNECSKFPSSFTRLRIPRVRRIRSIYSGRTYVSGTEKLPQPANFGHRYYSISY